MPRKVLQFCVFHMYVLIIATIIPPTGQIHYLDIINQYDRLFRDYYNLLPLSDLTNTINQRIHL